MRGSQLPGARAVLWWCDRYTSAAHDDVRRERRAELIADLHDHVDAARAAGVSEPAIARAVVGRMLRGVPADVLWRIESDWARDRMRSSLSSPELVLGVLFVVLVPVTIAVDLSREFTVDATPVGRVYGVMCAACFTVAAAYVLHRLGGGLGAVPRRPPTGGQVRRATVLLMFATYPLSGVWRFAPAPLSYVSGTAWALFLGLLCLNVLFLFVRLVALAARSLDLRKIPS